MNPRLLLKPGKEKPVLNHHPWIFSGAIARVDGAVDGETVDICDATGRFLARGYYNSRSQIAARLWTWRDEPIDSQFLRVKLELSAVGREAAIDGRTTNAYRVVNAESDLLPGLVVDRYADFVVVQFLTLGIEKHKSEIVDLIAEIFQPRGIYERSDVDVREKEGLAQSVGVLRGEEPPDRVEIHENNFRFLVDVKRGHKTGFYLDQRDNRAQVLRDLSGLARAPRSPEILNVFSYTGAFAVYACASSPNLRVVNLDASKDALEIARENMRINHCEDRGEYEEGDAFQALRKYRDQARTFDVIILDPPKFVQSMAQLDRGLRGYKDINLLGLKLLKPGGTLVTFSCSGQVSADLFQKVVFGAATDALKDVQIIGRLTQASDHPVLISFPESEYLKGLVCRVF